MNQSRSNGLDTLRALAIVLVFMFHYMVFVSGEPTFGWASTVGWVGVDLFFVLSGYLIGNQVLSGLARQRELSLSSFYARRTLRTWPAFWVVLVAYFLFPSVMGGNQPPPLWRFLTFTQNYQLPPGSAFSHAWSLCIEEQFYFVLPLVVLVALRVGTHRYQAWLLLFILLATGVTARGILWSLYGRESVGDIAGYHPNIYYSTFCRFDEFLPGIAVAMIKNFHPLLWRRLMERGAMLFSLGVVSVAAAVYGVYSYYYIDGYGYSFFMTVFGYSCIAAAFSLLVASALSECSPLYFVRVPGAYRIALWSYSIYLSHKAVAFILNKFAKQYGFAPWLELVAITVMSVAVGALLYRFVELPFMNFRDRKFPALFHEKPVLDSGFAAT
jgi:peptidoglycan/LPS O-acetylase OafA/YrhL